VSRRPRLWHKLESVAVFVAVAEAGQRGGFCAVEMSVNERSDRRNLNVYNGLSMLGCIEWE